MTTQAARQHTTTHARNHPKPDRLRARMERAVEKLLAAAERLIAELDALEPDPDLEGDELEPSLGQHDDREGDDILDWPHDGEIDLGEGDNPDAEATLGWTEEGARIGYLGHSPADGEAEVENEHGTVCPDEHPTHMSDAARAGMRRARQAAKDMLCQRGLLVDSRGVCHIIEEGRAHVVGPTFY